MSEIVIQEKETATEWDKIGKEMVLAEWDLKNTIDCPS
jgi:hypothetical protein